MERWFHTLKTELVNHRDYLTRVQAKADTFEYIEVFYNRSRRHSGLGYMDPPPSMRWSKGLLNCVSTKSGEDQDPANR